MIEAPDEERIDSRENATASKREPFSFGADGNGDLERLRRLINSCRGDLSLVAGVTRREVFLLRA